MLIEASTPLLIRLPAGEIHLRPGQPVELSDDDGRKLLERAKGKVRRVTELRSGAVITWTGADLTVRRGLVDFLHVDPDGAVWAFYSLSDGTWGAVNTSYLTKSEPK